MTPFDKVKNQLIVKIHSVYFPQPDSLGGIISKASKKIDFTGQGDDEEEFKVSKTSDQDDGKKKKKMPDFS